MNTKPGAIGWIDLTTPNAPEVKDFYTAVVGWTTTAIPMGEYDDWCVHPEPGADAVAGLCHARGPNAGVPPQWLIYINVADLDASLQAVVPRGGRVLHGPRAVGGGLFAVVQDPSGAVCGLYQQPVAV